MRRVLLPVLVLLAALAAPLAAAGAPVPEQVRRLAVLHEGRVKPLDTFARANLLLLHEKSRIAGRDAVAWLLGVWRDPAAAGAEPLFRVRNEEVVVALGIAPSPRGLYSHADLAPALRKEKGMLSALAHRERGERTPAENQLVDLQDKVQAFERLSGCFAGLERTYAVQDAGLAEVLGAQPGERVGYRQVAARAARIRAAMDGGPAPALERALHDLLRWADGLANERYGTAPTLVPGVAIGAGEQWLSAWDLLDGRERAAAAPFLDTLEAFLDAVRRDDASALAAAAARLQVLQGEAGRGQTGLEVFYNRADFFTNSLALYVLAFLLAGVSLLAWPRGLRVAALLAAWGGLALCSAGLVLRMLIMGRPPVSNLYETVLFVGWTVVLCGLVLEHLRRDGLGLFLAASGGAALQFLGMRYAMEGDTLGMLVAVLDSNFWLATHVVTITLGYGAALMAGLLAHAWLVHAARGAGEDRLAAVLDACRGALLVALFFTLLGTLLGGIWADQSWGRFWGWDPKENGALLIVLWLLALMHGERSRLLPPAAYACGLALVNIVVAVAWFGVNLLGVGLHSYGFAGGVAYNLALFCAGEIILVAALLAVAFIRGRRRARN